MIQRLPESLQKQRVIFLIIDMGTDAGQRSSRVFPVDVDAVQAVGFHQRNGADCKKGSSLLGSCRLGETVGSPAAHRQYDLNVRVDLPDLRQIFFISARIPNNPVTLNESESNIDDIQIFNILFFQCSKIFCAYIADYFFHVLSLLLLFLLFHSGRIACTLRSPASPPKYLVVTGYYLAVTQVVGDLTFQFHLQNRCKGMLFHTLSPDP